MKKFIFALLALNITACSSMPYADAFKSEAQLRSEWQQDEQNRLASMTPEQREADKQLKAAMGDCVQKANAYGGSTPQGHGSIYKQCMNQKGL